METLIPIPRDAKKPRFSQLLGGGKRRIDLGGTSARLNEYCDEFSENFCCGPTSNPETRCNEIYEYELSNEVIERANLGFNLGELPLFMGIKGGTARQTLEALTHGDRQLTQPRDVDLVVLEEAVSSGGYDPDDVEAIASELSMYFSPRDAMNGYDAERVESVAEFMRQHDFTINQVLIYKNNSGGWKLLASTQAVLDTAEHIIRPTIFEHDISRNYRIGNKLALKAVRLLSEMQVQGIDDASIRSVELPDGIYGDPRDAYFMQVLQLDKALEVDYRVAERYVYNLRCYGMMPYGCEEMETTELYHELINRTDFVSSEGALNTIRVEEERWPEFSSSIERLLRQVPEQFSRDYCDAKKW